MLLLLIDFFYTMTWHAYFDENEPKTWTIYRFHKEWIHINEKDHENLVYGKAVEHS